jgi:hypothetical protein
MGLHYRDLDQKTRALMLDEFRNDEVAGRLYLSERLTPHGRARWRAVLKEALVAGDDETLGAMLRAEQVLEVWEVAHRNGRPYRKSVPQNAAETLAEGEFNRFYCRAICLRALSESAGLVEVYRAKVVTQPRSKSERLVGTHIDAQRLLDDLRRNIGIDTALGVPAGPNSGLCVRLLREPMS